MNASKVLVLIDNFDFVFTLLFMRDVLAITNELSKSLQRKDQDLVNAMQLVKLSKSRLNILRNGDEKFERLWEEACNMCDKYGIEAPDSVEGIYWKSKKYARRGGEIVTNKHHFKYVLMNTVLDQILGELDSRFDEVNMRLLECMASLDPSDNFRAFDKEKLIELAGFYPRDFDEYQLWELNGNLSAERLLTTIARERPIRFTSEQLEIITHDYAIKLGAGGFGDVYKGKLENGVKVAVKVLKNDSDRRVHEQFMAEVGPIGRTYHVNLVKLCGFCFTPTKRALVYEYMENGSLDKLLFGQSWLREWVKLHDIAIGTAKGIAYLHEGCEQRIIHYDIKPANVLLDLNFNPKVADFGLAQLCNTGTSLITLTGRGTPGYAAPELWMPYPVTRKCDVYSFGMLLFEIVARKENYDKQTQQWLPKLVWDMFVNDELLEMVTRFGIEEQQREKAMRMCTVALWCVQYLAEARPIMSTVVKMLEGVTEIPPPPNPFEHMRSNTFDYEGSYSDSMATPSRYIDEHHVITSRDRIHQFFDTILYRAN